MQYTPLKATRERLQSVAAGLGLRHHGRHDIGPTWYGDAATLVAVAVASLPLVHWLLDREMGPHNEDGSWRRNWAEGEVRDCPGGLLLLPYLHLLLLVPLLLQRLLLLLLPRCSKSPDCCQVASSGGGRWVTEDEERKGGHKGS